MDTGGEKSVGAESAGSSSVDGNQSATPAESEGLAAEFLIRIEEIFDRLQLKQNTRVLKDGFFVSESLFAAFCREFGLFAARMTGGSSSVDARLIRKLFSTGSPVLYYLIEGKQCISGYCVDVRLDPKRFSSVAEFRGSLIEASTLLHPRDPRIADIAGVSPVLDRTGFGVWLEVRQTRFFADSASVREFHEAVVRSPKFRRKYPEAIDSLRGCLQPLQRLLANAREVPGNQMLLIPINCRELKTAVFYRVGGFVFVVDDRRLKRCYELRGANLRSFLHTELDEMRSKKRRRSGRFELSRKSGPIIGAVQLSGQEKALLHFDCLLQGLELIMRRRVFRKQMKSRVTVQEVVRVIAEWIVNTVRVESHEIPHRVLHDYLKHASQSHARKAGKRTKRKGDKRREFTSADLRYRAGGGLIFFLHNKNIVRALIERPAPQKQPAVASTPA